VFQATTPTKATITPESQSSSGPLVYDLHADSLTAIKFINDYNTASTTIATGAGISDAVVSISSVNGQVLAVAPFAVVGSAAKPALSKTGTQLTYNGKFLGVWNGQGKNLTPGGASQLVLDANTGKIVSYR
jgi:hypothetical protein